MRRHQVIILLIILFLLFILPIFYIFAEWEGPKQIISGKWGSEIGEFYFEHQDTADSFPQKFGIDKNGNIIISDEGNKRIYVFKPDGKLMNVIQKPMELTESDIVFGLWPIELKLFPNSNITFYCDYKQITGGYHSTTRCVMDYKGKILSRIDLAEMFIMPEGYFLKKNNLYYKYTYSGELLKTYNTEPLELGVIDEHRLSGGKYKTTIAYPDITYVTDRLTYHNYIRGCDQMLFATLYEEVVRYNEKSELIGDLVMPKAERKVVRPAGNGADELNELIVEYGEPVVAPNGDVYTWKRTTDKYSIIKWVWVDGPECPQYLDVTSTKNSLKFTWQKPLKGADKITYYQLLQSYNICGPFRQTALLKKDQLSYEDRDVKKGETYYYMVKAVRGKEYSGNSNKVCGQVE